MISGASGGIGEEVGLQYAKKGAKLVLAARSSDNLIEVSKRCLEKGAAQIEVKRCDVSVEADCKDLIHFAMEKYGAIDILVLNAGIGQVSVFLIYLGTIMIKILFLHLVSNSLFFWKL